ncbi:hypothetical protein M2324_002373 [Rhodovulum sulfidophilum]|nr:hypothetical protein A6W98_14720 [Rhodovulum sulfidophilum DSM 1374]ANB39032.1 hypothetical protein A6024_14585 [Rhodovulum sulfidophilum]MCW2303969.1 hypothetical protein [Rhodovulum sulfidophilum]
MIYNTRARDAFARMIETLRPDIVHAFAIYVRLTPAILDAAREAGVPVVLSCNDYKHLCPNYKLFHHGRVCTECRGGRFHRALVNRCCHGSLAVSAASMIEAYIHDRLDLWRRNVSIFLFASRFMAAQTEAFWDPDRIDIDFLRNPFDVDAHRGGCSICPRAAPSMAYRSICRCPRPIRSSRFPPMASSRSRSSSSSAWKRGCTSCRP